MKAPEAVVPAGGVAPRDALRFTASLAVSASLCWLLLRQIDLHDVWHWITHVDRTLFAAYAALSIGGLLARSFRYHLLIGRFVGFWPIVLVTAARNFLVDLLPARVGSLSYVYLLTRRFGAPLEPVLSSFVVTFFYDLFAMTLLIGVAVALELGRFENGLALAGVAAVLGLCVVLVFLRLASSLRLAAGWLRPRAEKIAERIDETAHQIEQTGGTGQTLWLLAISFVIRLLKFAAYWALLLGVVREQNVGAAALPFWRVFLGIAGAELSATLPIHGIAGIGTYETAWAVGFQELGVPWRVAILSGFATHLLSQIWDYSLGVVALALALAWTSKGRPR